MSNPPLEKPKKDWSLSIATGIFLISLAARIIKLIIDPVLLRDAAACLKLSEIWYHSGEYSQTTVDNIVVPPLPIFAIKKMMEFEYPFEIAGRSIALFFGSMLPVLGYIALSKLFKERVIRFTGVIFLLLHPTLVSYSIQPMRENYYLFFSGLIIIGVINAVQKNKSRDWGICGALSAFALFCRYEAFEMLLICPAILFFLLIRKRMSFCVFTKHLSHFLVSSVAGTLLLLSITEYDLTFIKKITNYKDNVIKENIVDFLFYPDFESNK